MQLTKPYRTLFLIFLVTLCVRVSYAQDTPQKGPLTTTVKAFQLNADKVLLAVTLDMEPDWYTYADKPGGMGKPTQITGTTASGAEIVTFYPAPIAKPNTFEPGTTINIYKPGTTIFIAASTQAPIFPIAIRLDLLLCHPTKCVPVRKDITFGTPDMEANSLPSAESQAWWPDFSHLTKPVVSEMQSMECDAPVKPDTADWQFTPRYLQPGLEVTGLLSAILMGLLAGLILNVMPCVLPVVSLKLSALLNSSNAKTEEERIRQFREHNAFFALGVLAFFLGLAIALGITGQAWGALFQKTWLVLGIAGVILLLSLSLFGLFHLPIIDLKFGEESKNPRVKAFFTGNLTTLLATPCSGPFLGGVLSWALVQGPTVIATVFISIGIGMASPYILLIINPRLSRYLPKAGPWIEFVEKGIAFFLVATAFYLVSIALGSASLRILAPLWGILFGGWLIKRTNQSDFNKKWGVRIFTLALLACLIILTIPKQETTVWEPFNAKELSQRIGNEPIFLDFTADWCPTCKALEATVLTPSNVRRWKKKYGVTFIKVDMTEDSVETEALLKALGSMSIPTAAMIPTGKASRTPMVVRDIFTKTQLENILKSWKK